MSGLSTESPWDRSPPGSGQPLTARSCQGSCLPGTGAASSASHLTAALEPANHVARGETCFDGLLALPLWAGELLGLWLSGDVVQLLRKSSATTSIITYATLVEILHLLWFGGQVKHHH